MRIKKGDLVQVIAGKDSAAKNKGAYYLYYQRKIRSSLKV